MSKRNTLVRALRAIAEAQTALESNDDVAKMQIIDLIISQLSYAAAAIEHDLIDMDAESCVGGILCTKR